MVNVHGICLTQVGTGGYQKNISYAFGKASNITKYTAIIRKAKT